MILTTLPQVGNWARWLSDFLGMDADSFAKDEKKTPDDDDNRGTEEPKSFPLLNALSDLLMLPKDLLMDRTVRMEVSQMIIMFSSYLSFMYSHLCTGYSSCVFLYRCVHQSVFHW